MDAAQGGDTDGADDATRAEERATSIHEPSTDHEEARIVAPVNPPVASDPLDPLDPEADANSESTVGGAVDAEWGQFKEVAECTRVALEMDASSLDSESFRAWAFRAPVSLERDEEIKLESCIMIDMSQVERTSKIHALLDVADGGLYHGQVEEEQLLISETSEADVQLRPHGYGVWTKSDGSCAYGQWEHGVQSGFGSIQMDGGVLSYEGECHDGNITGYGVGLFAHGSVFIGSWREGRPYGLGSLHQQDPAPSSIQYGWFYGTTCMQPCPPLNPLEVAQPQRLRLARQADADQPTRGLRLLGAILDDARLDAFRRVLHHWRHECCVQAVLRARQCRLLAVTTRQRSLRAQQSAVQADMAMRTNLFQLQQADVVGQVALTRKAHARVQRIRALHVQRQADAEHQCALAKTCVATQSDAIVLMEAELQEVMEALEMAKTAQSDCRQLSHQLHVHKRQIENACVKINALKVSERNQQQQSELSGSAPSTPWTASDSKTPASRGTAFISGGRRTSNNDPEAKGIVQQLVLPDSERRLGERIYMPSRPIIAVPINIRVLCAPEYSTTLRSWTRKMTRSHDGSDVSLPARIVELVQQFVGGSFLDRARTYLDLVQVPFAATTSTSWLLELCQPTAEEMDVSICDWDTPEHEGDGQESKSDGIRLDNPAHLPLLGLVMGKHSRYDVDLIRRKISLTIALERRITIEPHFNSGEDLLVADPLLHALMIQYRDAIPAHDQASAFALLSHALPGYWSLLNLLPETPKAYPSECLSSLLRAACRAGRVQFTIALLYNIIVTTGSHHVVHTDKLLS